METRKGAQPQINFGMFRNFLHAHGVLLNQAARAVRACRCFTLPAVYKQYLAGRCAKRRRKQIEQKLLGIILLHEASMDLCDPMRLAWCQP